MYERSIGLSGLSEWHSLDRRALIGGIALALATPCLSGEAHAHISFRQSGPNYARLMKVIDRIWREQNLPPERLELRVINSVALRAEVTLSGKVWMTTGFVAFCDTEAQAGAWFCQTVVALRTKAAGVPLDRDALAVLLATGYDPRLALKLWTRWAKTKNLLNSSRFTDIPTTPVRLQALRSEIEKLGYLI